MFNVSATTYLNHFKLARLKVQDILQKIDEKKLVVIVIISIPDPFNGFHKNEHNLAITCRSHLEFWDHKVKDDFS